jgi:quinol monooxygenase YgiN
MLNVIVTMKIKEGRMQDFLTVCGELRPLVLKEKGCQGYDYLRDTASPLGIQEPVDADRVTLLERWESVEALTAHLATPHMKEAGLKMKELRSSVSARVFEPIF